MYTCSALVQREVDPSSPGEPPARTAATPLPGVAPTAHYSCAVSVAERPARSAHCIHPATVSVLHLPGGVLCTCSCGRGGLVAHVSV